MFSKKELHERIEKMTEKELAELLLFLRGYRAEPLPGGSVAIHQNGEPLAVQEPIK